jgi:malate dehydrogenase
VTVKDGVISIVKDLPVSDFSRSRMDMTEAELKEERDAVLKLLRH